MPAYRTAPEATDRMPRGIPFIIGNEAAERFSFYGMKAILAVFMAQYLVDRSGHPDPMTENDATFWVHVFTAAVYATPLLGAVLSDVWFGKYRTIIVLSLVYCLGHLALAIDDTRLGLVIGLSLIALGAGGIKPCVQAHVGDQFGRKNHHRLERVFGWFYIAINLGAFTSMLLTPELLHHEDFGPAWAFGVPGVLMGLATLVFWLGRRKFAHIPPFGAGFLKQAVSGDGKHALWKIISLMLFVAVFWSLFDQTASRWVFQAQKMDRNLLGWEVKPSQMQSVNPFLILTLIPLFAYVLYPAIEKRMRLLPMRKVVAGFVLAAASFGVAALLESSIRSGGRPWIAWQFLAYVFLTSGEILVSVTCLEYAYTQAPRAMKSFIMSIYLASVALGNLLTAAVTWIIANPDGTNKIDGATYYWFFAGMMLMTAVVFLFVTRFYQDKTYIHDDESIETMEEAASVRE